MVLEYDLGTTSNFEFLVSAVASGDIYDICMYVYVCMHMYTGVIMTNILHVYHIMYIYIIYIIYHVSCIIYPVRAAL